MAEAQAEVAARRDVLAREGELAEVVPMLGASTREVGLYSS